MGFLIRKPKRNDHQVNTFQNEMSQLMDDFFSDSWGRFPALSQGAHDTFDWQPKVNVSESNKQYKVTVELPGLEQDDLDVSFDDNTLYIKGERKFEKETEEENYHHVESAFGRFQRSLPFAKKVDPEKIKAKFKNGVLTLKLEKAQEEQNGARKISIN